MKMNTNPKTLAELVQRELIELSQADERHFVAAAAAYGAYSVASELITFEQLKELLVAAAPHRPHAASAFSQALRRLNDRETVQLGTLAEADNLIGFELRVVHPGTLIDVRDIENSPIPAQFVQQRGHMTAVDVLHLLRPSWDKLAAPKPRLIDLLEKAAQSFADQFLRWPQVQRVLLVRRFSEGTRP